MPCFDDLGDIEPEADVRLWSNAASWAPGSIPIAGESFTIDEKWNMEYDIEGASLVFGAIEVKGILRFSNDKDITLNCKRIFINGGKFGIGTKSRPYLKKGGVTLHGAKEDPDQLALEDIGITAGTKIIANLGELKLYGKLRTFKMTRL